MKERFHSLLGAVGLSLLGLGTLLTLPGCSGGGGSGTLSNEGGFQLIQTNLSNNEIWAINRAITFRFNTAVDFGTVNMNTINVQTSSGTPAVGTFSFRRLDDGTEDTSTIVFQPACPTEADLSDAGLEPGGIPYVITVRGLSGGTTNTVRSQTGQSLAVTQTRTFTTPVALDPTQAFIDNVPGPPVPVVRLVGSMETSASYLEVGGTDRVYFEFDEVSGTYTLSDPAFEVPLNLYSDPASKVAAVLEFNQPVDPSLENLSSNRLRIEVLTGASWVPVDSEVELSANCTLTGATVRIEPRGILPPGDGLGLPNMRVVVASGFQDVVGQTNLVNIVDFAQVPTREIDFASLVPAGDESDEVFEDFQLSGTTFGSLEDTDALFEAPTAEWGNGLLTAAFDFQGTGGPGGNFDWVIGTPGGPAESFFFSTTSQQILGGPGGAPSALQVVSNGVLNVRNLVIEDSMTVSAQGVNPLVINATGDVIIRGTLSVNGTRAQDVATLNSGNLPSTGGTGQAGGGRGGRASTVVNASTPAGSQGFGPFDIPNSGGFGGESQFATGSKDRRRPAGGGGGAHSMPAPAIIAGEEAYAATNVNPWPFPETVSDPRRGLIARQGLGGHPLGTGAISNSEPAVGGLPGPLVFNDTIEENNFFGTRAELVGGDVVLTRGELSGLVPGTGGGGGGDAVPSNVFPQSNWNPGSDEKGGGGGGGAGALRIRALGRVIITGTVSAEGGRGGVGENTNFLDHIGGGGGSGSGGHIVIESGSKVYLGRDPETPGFTFQNVDALTALGGISNYGEPTTGGAVSIGGQGGPGLIQIHVPNPLNAPGSVEANTDVVLPAGEGLVDVTSPTAVVLVPNFSKRSLARSKWLSLGSADVDPGTGGLGMVRFLFDGTDPGVDSGMLEPGEGEVLADPSPTDPTTLVVRELDPVLGGLAGEPIDGTLVSVTDDDTLVLTGAGLDGILVADPSKDVYLRTPTLLKNFLLRLTRNAGTASETLHEFEVVDAAYLDDVATPTLSLVTTSASTETLQEVLDLPGTADVVYQVIPRFFRVQSSGVLDRFSENATVAIQFQATGATSNGDPDLDDIQVDWTGDISQFDLVPAGDLKFFRFRVEFDLDKNDVGLTPETQRVSLQFLRVPFRF